MGGFIGADRHGAMKMAQHFVIAGRQRLFDEFDTLPLAGVEQLFHLFGPPTLVGIDNEPAMRCGLADGGKPLSDETSTAMYIGMGWTGLLCYCELARRLSRRAIRPVWVGGLIYSIGAIINELKWPVLWPGVLGSHELFHIFVMAASWCHFTFMLRVVAPFEQQALVPVLEPIPIFAAEQAPA